MTIVMRAVTVALSTILWIEAPGPVHSAEDRVEKILAIHVVGGQVPEEMKVLRATKGEFIRFRWTADSPITVHLHGYDIERQVVPGPPTEFTFEAYATGRFPVHVHKVGQHSQAHNAPLVTLEVYPR